MPTEISIFVGVALLVGLFLVYIHWLGHLAGKFEDWVYADTLDEELPRRTLAYFEKIERELLALGFKRVATCMQRPKPKLTYVRHMIHQDRRVFATIDDVHYPMWLTQSYGFVSVLENGLYIESAALNMPHPRPEHDKLRFVIASGVTAEELLEMHLAEVRSAEAEQGAPAIVFEPKQFRDVATYGHRLAGWDMFHRGLKHEPPTELAELAAR
jgi:hypothetical protein